MHIFLFCILVFCISHLSASVRKDEIKEKILSIPIEDLQVLEEFFRNLLFQRGFAYTLFGDKPVSVEHYDRENPNKPELFLSSAEEYKIWEKYAPLFPGKNYIFLFYEDCEENICEITMINKKAFHRVVAENRGKFAEFFGPNITSEKLLILLIQKGSLWNTPLKNRDNLIGILLGFGRHNAELFHKRNEIESYKMKLTRDRTKPSSGYHSTEEELEVLNATLQSFSNEGMITLNYMRLPGFVADSDHNETKQLKRKYTEQRRSITQRYSRENVLEAALEQLCSTSSK